MAKKKRRIPSFDPLLCYINARSYLLASNTLHAQPHASVFFWPTMALEAFCLELHLKCLHRVRRRNINGHDVHKLFGLLSKNDRKRLAAYFHEFITAHPNYAEMAAKGVPFDVDSVLMRASNMFMRGRYWHEGQLPARDPLGYASNAGIGNLSDAINRLLLELHPDWTSKLHAFRLTLPGMGRLPS